MKQTNTTQHKVQASRHYTIFFFLRVVTSKDHRESPPNPNMKNKQHFSLCPNGVKRKTDPTTYPATKHDNKDHFLWRRGGLRTHVLFAIECQRTKQQPIGDTHCATPIQLTYWWGTQVNNQPRSVDYIRMENGSRRDRRVQFNINVLSLSTRLYSSFEFPLCSGNLCTYVCNYVCFCMKNVHGDTHRNQDEWCTISRRMTRLNL